MRDLLKHARTNVKLHDVALINPRLQSKLLPDELVAFVPMAAMSSERAELTHQVLRPYHEVAKGFTAFENRDVLVAKITPCFENNKIGQANLPCQFGFGSTEFHVIRAFSDLACPRYLMHFLRQDHVREEGQRKMTGSAGQRRVPEHFLSALEISLPSLPEQRRIAAILDQADALRAKRRVAITQLDELAQSVFEEMFGDLVSNSKGWDVRPLGDAADLASGITKGRKVPNTDLRSVPYLAVANVQDHALKLTNVKNIEASNDEIDRYRLQVDDLVLTEGGDPDKLGRGVLWNGELPECIHQNHIFRVRLTSAEMQPTFLNWLISSRHGKDYFLRSAKQTTGIASINMTQLRSFPLRVPPIALQNDFANRIIEVRHIRDALLRSSARVNGLFASLQHRAFSGSL